MIPLHAGGFFLFDIFCAWPDQLVGWERDPSVPRRIASLVRLQQFHHAEAVLLSAALDTGIVSSSQFHVLMAMLRLSQHQLESALYYANLIQDDSSAEGRFFQTQIWLLTNETSSLQNLPDSWWLDQNNCALLAAAHVSWLITIGDFATAESIIEQSPKPHCMELVRFKARLLAARGLFQQASDCLLPAALRFPQHLSLQGEMASLLIDARSRDGAIPFLRKALLHHGEQPELLPAVSHVKQLQREPAQSRRSQLQLQAAASVRSLGFNPAGLVVAYEQCGYASWMPYLHPFLHQQPVQTSAIQSNLCMYLSSVEAPEAEAHVRGQVSRLMSVPEFQLHAQCGLPPIRPEGLVGANTQLRVAWLTGDLVHHPVSRFLLGYFKAAPKFRHQHFIVDLVDHEVESVADRFLEVPGLQRLDLGRHAPNQKLAAIRELQPHVAIDLSGWTDGNFVTGFMARMAPLQINYLGYFASTGIPAMDYWLGDSHLFPEPILEWHSERIARLSRCFIAWQPSYQLPEAHAEIASGPLAAGIRFGSFNHNRKLSDQTLRLWGRLLKAIPESSLVLKANQQGDEATQILLRRRMQRQGLDPERVIWLPIAPTPEEHLKQYAHMDVALDCFPNGGCTTTCEALWMGVPVITLTGRSYVSRMSTAVLHGAGLHDWCVASEQEYLDLAIRQAANLSWLRQNRSHWRQQVISNPLGDAADLMQHLEACFSTLYLDAAKTSPVIS
jgi:protein O-GlcNAc transferase